MITLYGSRNTTAARSLWALEELEIEYHHVPVDVRYGETRSKEYLTINPNGRVPTLVDGELSIFESMAINFYLARKYGAPLAAKTERGWDYALMWSFWATNELEQLVRQIVRNRIFLSNEERNEKLVSEAEELLRNPLQVLDDRLDERPYLLGGEFSVADVNVGHIALWLPLAGVNLKPWKQLTEWIHRCEQRPALMRLYSGRRTIGEDDKIPRGTPDLRSKPVTSDDKG